MISQITWLTAAARTGSWSVEPSGLPASSVRAMRHVVHAELVGGGLQQHRGGRAGGQLDGLGPVMVMGGVEVASIRTATGSSRPLVTVTEKLPLLLDRMTRRGAATEIEREPGPRPSRSC